MFGIWAPTAFNLIVRSEKLSSPLLRWHHRDQSLVSKVKKYSRHSKTGHLNFNVWFLNGQPCRLFENRTKMSGYRMVWLVTCLRPFEIRTNLSGFQMVRLITWLGPFKIWTCNVSSIQMNPVFGCPVFGWLLYIALFALQHKKNIW